MSDDKLSAGRLLELTEHVADVTWICACKETILALIAERERLLLDLDYERARSRACSATGAEWRFTFNRCLAIESDVGTPEEMEYHVTRMKETIDQLSAERERLLKLFDDAGQGEHNVLALVELYQARLLEQEDEIGDLRDRLAKLERVAEAAASVANLRARILCADNRMEALRNAIAALDGEQ